MNILYLGRSNTFLSDWHIKSLSKIPSNLVIANTHPKIMIKEMPEFYGKIYNIYENRKSFANIVRNWIKFYPRFLLNSYKWHPYDKETFRILTEIIRDNKIDLVYGWWGSDIFYELLIVSKVTPPVKTVWISTSFPSGLFQYKHFLEMLLAKKVINKLDGIAYGSQIMQDYIEDNFNISNKIKKTIFLQTTSQNGFFKKQLPKLSENDGNFHIVFLGRTDFSRKIGRVKDDIRYILYDLKHENIVIHIANTSSSIKTNNIMFFESFSYKQVCSGDLATFLTQFDAILVAFNYKDIKYYERFDAGIPSRMSSAISSGIPIIIPEGTMKACADFVIKNEIGFTYKNSEDLLKKIKTENFEVIKKNAIKKVFDFTFEKEFEKVKKLLLEI